MDAETSHPLKPFLPRGAGLLMLGTFPPPRQRWSMDFYYPNFANDMWRIFGLAFFGDASRFVLSGKKAFDKRAIESFLRAKKIALYDCAESVVRARSNASDKYLQIERRADLPALLSKIPRCRAIAATGGKAAETIAGVLGAELPRTGEYSIANTPNGGIRFWKMPSSSRAYPMKLEQKAAVYKKMFSSLGLA
ncbi:MAG: uracil-DNA glycosylase family protein [Opitutales bacterium]|nr:uracil-DNA glycosylase family protein [Opitutales bacterium]